MSQVSSSSLPHIDNQNGQVMWPTVEELLLRADSLCEKFRQDPKECYIEEAIILDREALAMCNPGHPLRSDCLSCLSGHLWRRHEQFGGMHNIEEAIGVERKALELRPPGNEDRSTSLYSLAIYLYSRHQQRGQAEDLSEAIDLGRQALLLCSQGHPDRPYVLCNLASCLRDRYNQLGGVDDLDEAIDLAREDLELCPSNNLERSTSLNNFAAYLSDRYRLLGGMKDLSEAIDIHREALELRPLGHPLRLSSLGNLAMCLSYRYLKLGVARAGDLSEAIDLQREALKLCPSGHPSRPLSLNNLATSLVNRNRSLGTVEDLSEAISIQREALMLCPLGHPDHLRRLMNLASCLFDKYEQLHNEDDREEMFSLYNELTCTGQSVSTIDLSAVRAWIKAAEHFHHSTTVLAYKTALRLLVQYVTVLPTLPQHLGTLRGQSSSLAIDAFSACLRNQSPASSVELLEQGRSLSWNQLARLRSPLDDVTASGSEGRALAENYAHLTLLIEDALNSANEDRHDRVSQLNVALASTVSKIRELPGLSCFLLPLPFSDLRQAASGGPIVIVNASRFSCDALVVSVDSDPFRIPLLVTTEGIQELVSDLARLLQAAKKEDVERPLQFFLRKLWDLVVSRIADTLLATYPPRSRIWWCPTSDFSLLPLHAAAPYREGQKGFSQLYISSYTPTLSALIRSRRSTPLTSASDRKRFIAIGQANAAGTSKLHTVATELADIRQQMNGLTTFTSIEGQDSRIFRVVDELNKNAWVHIACHGLPKRSQPFESAFALGDGRLTIQRIMQCDPQHAEFAYLSACHTTVGDKQSPDEALHLAAAMQFAGFRSVIGTMWAVDDAQTGKITSTFYRHMVDDTGRLDHTRAAYALWRTMRSVKVPLDQRILYVHIGA